MENQRVVLEVFADNPQSTHLTPDNITTAKQIILSTFRAIKDKDRTFKREAYEKMELRLRDAGTEYKALEKEEKKKIENVLPGKANAPLRAEKYKELTPKWKHEVYDPIFKTFERQRFFGTMTLGSLTSEIQINLANARPPMVPGYIAEKNTTVILVGDKNGLGGVQVAIVYKQEARFIKIQSGVGVLPDIFKHRENQRHYVRDRYGIFIPRFLLRNLSEYDMQLLTNGLSSRDGRAFKTKASGLEARSNQEREFVEAVVRHLRAAQQGGSYFVSTTSTLKNIYGSTGKNFYTPQNGQVVIDAALIPQDDLVDVHSPMAMAKMLGVTNFDWTLEFSETDKSYQAMAAARDAIRTREIIVHGGIPPAAIARIRSKKLTFDSWVQPACRTSATVPPEPIEIRVPT